MFDTRKRLFFAYLKGPAGAALKCAALAPGSDQQKNRLRLTAPQHCLKHVIFTGTNFFQDLKITDLNISD